MARGSIVRLHVALQLTYLAFRRETRCGKWSFSNGWATHDETRGCCSAGLTSLFSPFIEIVGQEGKTERDKGKLPEDSGWTGTFRRITSTRAVISRVLASVNSVFAPVGSQMTS